MWHAISGAKRTNELRSRVRTPTRPSNGRSRPSFSSLFFSAFRVFLYTTSSIAPLPRSVRQRVARFTPRLSHPEPQCCSAPLCIHTYATGALAFSFFFFSSELSGERAAVSRSHCLNETTTESHRYESRREEESYSVIEASSSTLKRRIFEIMGRQGSQRAAGTATECLPQSFTAGRRGALLFLTRVR